MPNVYADLRSFKRQFVRDVFADIDEDLFLFYLEQASRDIDNYVGGGEQWRKFYTEYSTKTFYVDNENRDAIRSPAGGYTGYGTQFGYTETWPILIRGQRSLVVPDLLELQEISVSPRYRNQFDIEDLTGFDLLPFNVTPKLIVRHRVGIFLNANRINVKGKWGYSDERKDTRHTIVGSSIDSVTDTTIMVNRASGTVPVLQRGQTVILGSDGVGISDGRITRIVVEDRGSGYLTVPNVTIIGGGGSGATATAVIANGVVTAINITNGGSGYVLPPRVNIAEPAAPESGQLNRQATASVSYPAEQCFIESVEGLDFDDDGSVSSSDLMYTITVRRAMNGTSANAYDDRTKIYEPVYPAPIRQSCIDLALRKHRGRDVEWSGIGTEVEGLTDILSPIAAQLAFYRRSKMRIEKL